ncbi:hypothetical protein ID866_9733 [Astraeus odoratus]|nr:hypothetical protein ID866_9733 [Astraeus odoratus]
MINRYVALLGRVPAFLENFLPNSGDGYSPVCVRPIRLDLIPLTLVV